MPQIEARAWWDDVQHLRKEAPAGPAPLRLAGPEPERHRPRHPEPVDSFEEAFGAPLPPQHRERLPARRRVLLVTEDDHSPAPARRAVELLEPASFEDVAAVAPRAAAATTASAASLLPARRTDREERPARLARSATGARLLASPDRIALYAVVLGLLLVMIAAGSAHS